MAEADDRPLSLFSCPPLPEKAQIDPSRGEGASPWLDRYVAFSRKWSPRAYEGFHEACGLWVLATVAARRVLLHLGKPRYTPLFIALVARTSLYAKSTTADIAIDVLRMAGLEWLLAADEATPQKFIQDLTPRLPEDFVSLPDGRRARLTLRLAFAGQRGWFYEEFGQHLQAMNRKDGYMAEFRGIIRRMDDCKDRYEYGTISRGSDVVERPYLALLANLTPADLKPLARRGSSMWNDGFWARFAFVTPHHMQRKQDRFPSGERIIPSELITPLHEWHERLGVPEVRVEPKVDSKGDPTGEMRAEVALPELRACTLGEGVEEAFYTYHDGLLEFVERSDNHDLDGNYSRFAEKALRIAMLLASLENGGKIEMPHWARGQAIAERWRADLHALYQEVNSPEPSEAEALEERILDIVQAKGMPTLREIAQQCWGKSSADLRPCVERLVRKGELEEVPSGKTARYRLPQDEDDEEPTPF